MKNQASRPIFRLAVIVAMLSLSASFQGAARADVTLTDQDDGGGYGQPDGDQGNGQSTEASSDDECGATVEASRC